MGGPTALLASGESVPVLPTHQRHAEHPDQKHREACRLRDRLRRDFRLPIDGQFAAVCQIVAERLAHRELADIRHRQRICSWTVLERTRQTVCRVVVGVDLVAGRPWPTIGRIVVPGVTDHRAVGVEPCPARRIREEAGRASEVLPVQHGSDGGLRSALVLRRRLAGGQNVVDAEQAFGEFTGEYDAFDGLRRERNLAGAAVREGRGVGAESIGHGDRKRHWRGTGTGGTHEQRSNGASNDSQSSQIMHRASPWFTP